MSLIILDSDVLVTVVRKPTCCSDKREICLAELRILLYQPAMLYVCPKLVPVLEDFRKKFQEPTKHALSVNINLYIHNVAHAGNANTIINDIDRSFSTALGGI